MTYRVVTRAYAGVANFKSGPFLTHPVIKLHIRARFTNDLNTHVMCMNFSELTCVVYEHFRTSTM